MLKLHLSPGIRISVSLALFAMSLLLVGDMLGWTPDESEVLQAARKQVGESLAARLSSAVERGDEPLIRETLDAAVAWNPDLLSGAVQIEGGALLAEAGNHRQRWSEGGEQGLTASQFQVPIYRGERQWGSVQLHFRAPRQQGMLGSLGESLVGFIAFLALSGFLSYEVFARRTLQRLDPSGTIPKRVKAAFDVLPEGVMVLDEEQRIVLANAAFADKLEKPSEELEGGKASELGFRDWNSGEKLAVCPWQRVIEQGTQETGIFMTLDSPSGLQRTFVVNCTPILDSKGHKRGALVGFSDMTALEEKNNELQGTLEKLERTQEEISRQNQELKVLAMRDSLTGCLNRRSFFEKFETAFNEVRRDGGELSCIMVDIDHFKSINDRYGHANGDKVIKVVAGILQNKSRTEDLVGRYGGEEFCVIMPGLDIEGATELAERLRQELQEGREVRFTFGMGITASFGIASLECGAINPGDLINQADQALYVAKKSGRNRAIRFDHRSECQSPPKDAGQEFAFAGDATGDDRGIKGPVKSQKLQVRIEELELALEERSRELEFQSNHDGLTGLPNRMLFFDRVKQTLVRARRNRGIIAVLSLDIDMFKRVNNTLGHVVGDRLLSEAGRRLLEILREVDTVSLFGGDNPSPTVSRLGNDEFGVLLSEVDSVESVTWIVKRLVDSLSECIEIEEHEFYITSSIGISIFPNDGETPEILLKNAGAARHHAKNQLGRNSWQYYSEDINESSLERIQLESQLRHAAEYGEFELHYQPRVDLVSKGIVSMEALIRWRHLERGMVSPAQFIPLAEHTGLILSIGEWVMRTACRQLKTWIGQGHTGLRIAVNLSTLQLRQAEITDQVIAILRECELDPHYLEIEVTETVMMENMVLAVENLNRLHELGVTIAIDDFGTGYSSLSYLKYFPVDTLKIDRSFLPDIVNNPSDAAIVAGIVAMAHSMDLNVVAEGVETPEQEALMRSMRCDELQGYLFSKPLPAGEASELLHTHRRTLPAPTSGKKTGESTPAPMANQV